MQRLFRLWNETGRRGWKQPGKGGVISLVNRTCIHSAGADRDSHLLVGIEAVFVKPDADADSPVRVIITEGILLSGERAGDPSKGLFQYGAVFFG